MIVSIRTSASVIFKAKQCKKKTISEAAEIYIEYSLQAPFSYVRAIELHHRTDRCSVFTTVNLKLVEIPQVTESCLLFIVYGLVHTTIFIHTESESKFAVH